MDDLHFIRAALRENHPGPVDTANPWFRDWFDRGFREARALAEQADSYAGYYFSIQYYMNGFQDGHLGALGDDRVLEPKLSRRWPGFLVRWDGDQFVAYGPPGTTPPVPSGARLLECDGRVAASLAEATLRTYVGLWSVNGVRSRLAPYLLIDEGNPFEPVPRRCTFQVGSRTIPLALNWAPLANQTLASWLKGLDAPPSLPIGLRTFGNRRYWITLSSFNGGDSATVNALLRVRDTIAADAVALRAADLVVFDVRGNSGGNSRFGDDVATALWGERFIEAARPRAAAVDWRVSAGNARFLRTVNLRRLEDQFGAAAPFTREYASFVAAMDSSVRAGGKLLRQSGDPGPAPGPLPQNLVRARVVLLTDSHCFSACLDFADVVLALPGVVHAGQETSADAVYIDNRSERLPSGEGWVGFSMKVYRGRPRGHNQSYVPGWPWDEPMGDTAALERWLAEKAMGR